MKAIDSRTLQASTRLPANTLPGFHAERGESHQNTQNATGMHTMSTAGQ